MTDVAWQRRLRFLLETQGDDGTWHVVRRTFPFQPTTLAFGLLAVQARYFPTL